MPKPCIRVRGARQNNLKNLDLDLPLNELIVVTGVSGSGKSSLAFDTIYAEGQRRYVETFSPYARQFLDRMDKPQVDHIDGIPPAIAIDQTNPVRTSRSTVGTMTELNDHLKLLFARLADLYCYRCGQRVQPDDPESIYKTIQEQADTSSLPRILITFDVAIPKSFSSEEVMGFLARQGYTRILSQTSRNIVVIQDRLRLGDDNRSRAIEALEAALKYGHGELAVRFEDREPGEMRFSSRLDCANCGEHFAAPVPNSFSFNSPLGACDSCRGFGRTMGIDYRLVIPDESKSLAEGAIRPLQSKTYLKFQAELLRYAKARGVDVAVPWCDLSEAHKRFVIAGEGTRTQKRWFGVTRFFAWLERKSYRMHIRVLLAKYRSYDLCDQCLGSRLKKESLAWRIGSRDEAETVGLLAQRFRHPGFSLDDPAFATLPGLSLHDIVNLSLERALGFFDTLGKNRPLDAATRLIADEIRSRLRYLNDVGLGYLTLDRQSRSLSGGEVQRINLTTALGTSLVNTLFVLDEPSIGLHSKDVSRLIEVLKRLRDSGNTLLVVEHDAEFMLAADRVLDLGPGPGAAGGRVVYNGTPAALLRNAAGKTASTTAKFLAGLGGSGDAYRLSRDPSDRDGWIEVRGARHHNLQDIDVRIPLNRLSCVTGVSGSGKSTLIQDTLFNGLLKILGKPKDVPGECDALVGAERIADVVFVDQSPIGKTTRSNPASFVGVFEPIRKLFADEPLARERGYTAGTFSFNAGTGRCPTCSGNGYERIEMQFLSDIFLRCVECGGNRYRAEILEVKFMPGAASHEPKSIAQVLELTVAEAVEFFAGHDDVLKRLAPMQAVGLDYMSLGQSVPTLSGGEAQRLKLAAHLGKARPRRGGVFEPMLFLFDEPTTGLHFSDVEKLINALDRLVDVGHTVVVVEHNLQVINSSDWIIDLGPEGGEYGGEIVVSGSVEDVSKSKRSHTGRALSEYRAKSKTSAESRIGGRPRAQQSALKISRTASRKPTIEIVNAREHNLRNINVSIPRDKFTVITGVSGSGKSTVAFDILFAEGQRRYLESLNAYARQFVEPATRADVDAVHGIPPTISIEQRTSRGGRKSTVATSTELYHFLRLLFVKLGIQHCPDCDVPINEQTAEAITAAIQKRYRGRDIELFGPLVIGRKGYYTDLADWAASKGFSELRVDGQRLPTADWPRLDRFREHDIELPVGGLKVDPAASRRLEQLVGTAILHGRGMVRVVAATKRKQSIDVIGELFSSERACPKCSKSFAPLDPRLFSYNSKYGWCSACFGTGRALHEFAEEDTGEEESWLELEGDSEICGACRGTRLRPEATAVRFKDCAIHEMTALSVTHAERYFSQLKLSARETKITRDLLPEILNRLKFLDHVGLGYLTLDRSAPSLSGGEAQRIRLAAQLGSNLRGVCYVLDEPTIGLHARDNTLLLDTLGNLSARGNTVVVVEHDEDTIRRAEHIIDLGPGAGQRGGEVVVAGSLQRVMRNRRSATGRVLAKPPPHPMFARRGFSRSKDQAIEVHGATRHNLRRLSAVLPLQRLVCVSGVSGSGKSTLVHDVLVKNLKPRVGQANKKQLKYPPFVGCEAIQGFSNVSRLLEVDQTPIGKTPRSCPATYVGIWNEIRKIFASTAESRLRGYTPARFSFNVAGGRCDVCDGQGVRRISMSFLPDVSVHCERCGGDRFSIETLDVRFKDATIADILRMSVDDAVEFFAAHKKIHHTLALLADVGLGYLTLGQPSPTLSGGEAQRVKLVTELAKVRPTDLRGRTTGTAGALYVLDEPTIGLHIADVEKLLRVLHRLVDAGNSVIVIEHNLDVLAEADWLIDLGPEGGSGGGKIVAQGPPERVIARKRPTHTTKALAEFLSRQAKAGA